MKASDLPNWTFEIKQIAAGVYALHGADQRGHMVDAVGTDPHRLEEDFLEAAQAIEQRSKQLGSG